MGVIRAGVYWWSGWDHQGHLFRSVDQLERVNTHSRGVYINTVLHNGNQS